MLCKSFSSGLEVAESTKKSGIGSMVMEIFRLGDDPFFPHMLRHFMYAYARSYTGSFEPLPLEIAWKHAFVTQFNWCIILRVYHFSECIILVKLLYEKFWSQVYHFGRNINIARRFHAKWTTSRFTRAFERPYTGSLDGSHTGTRKISITNDPIPDFLVDLATSRPELKLLQNMCYILH